MNRSCDTISERLVSWADAYETTRSVLACGIGMTVTSSKTFVNIDTSEEVIWISTLEEWSNKSRGGAVQSIVLVLVSTITRVSRSTAT